MCKLHLITVYNTFILFRETLLYIYYITACRSAILFSSRLMGGHWLSHSIRSAGDRFSQTKDTRFKVVQTGCIIADATGV